MRRGEGMTKGPGGERAERIAKRGLCFAQTKASFRRCCD